MATGKPESEQRREHQGQAATRGTLPLVFHFDAERLEKLDRHFGADQNKRVLVRDSHLFIMAALVHRQNRGAVAEFFDIGIEQHLHPPGSDGLVQLAFIILKNTPEFTAAVGQGDAILLAQGNRCFHCTVAAAHHQNVFIPVFFRAVKPVINPLALFSRHPQLARIAALTCRQDDPTGAVFALRCLHPENIAIFFDARHRLLGAHVQVILLDDLAPAPDQVFLAGAIEPEFAFGRHRVRLRINPFPLREIFDGVSNFLLFQHDAGQALFLGCQRRVQSGGTATHHNHVVHGRIRLRRPGQ